MIDTREIDRLTPEGQPVAPPRRAPRSDRPKPGELVDGRWDWFYLLPRAEQAAVRRYCRGVQQPDQVAYSAGFDYVDDWAAHFVVACLYGAERGLSADADLRAATELVGVADVAELCGIPAGTVRVWAHRGDLPAPWATIGGNRIWLRDDVLEFAASRKSLETIEESTF